MDVALHIDPQDIAINSDSTVKVSGSTGKALGSFKDSKFDTNLQVKNTACINGGCAGSTVNAGCNNFGC